LKGTAQKDEVLYIKLRKYGINMSMKNQLVYGQEKKTYFEKKKIRDFKIFSDFRPGTVYIKES